MRLNNNQPKINYAMESKLELLYLLRGVRLPYFAFSTAVRSSSMRSAWS